MELREKKNVKTPHGTLTAPVFLPIATRGAVRGIMPEEISLIGFDALLSNTFHLWRRPGIETIESAGGLHKFIGWEKPILTDSGGYQVFSLESVISDEGVRLRDPVGGAWCFLTPEESIRIQISLGSDIIMVLDECPPYPATMDVVETAVARTSDWARRCKEEFLRHYDWNAPHGERPLLFGIVQGGIYENLRKISAKEIVEIGFDGYAIGGVAVGEPRETLPEILHWVLPVLPQNAFRYLMGLGRPNEIVAAVRAGVDLFDCVIPTREGRHGRLFVRKNKKINFGTEWYDVINITNDSFRGDLASVDQNCGCPLCTRFSRAFIRHLFSVGDPLAARLGALHNLCFYNMLIEEIISVA